MPKTRGTRLSCFYCGKRSLIKYDGVMLRFDCTSCDATNWLDRNGDITDPPAATTSEPVARPPTQYAISRASSPDPTVSFTSSFSGAAAVAAPSSEIFCATCLKHQGLFTACLAQYESESESDDDDDDDKPGPASSFSSITSRKPPKRQKDPVKSQRRYYAFRRNLEKLYPQVCDECEPKVIERVRQAGYTAKTDHLRRMMERSRVSRAAAAGGRSRTLLNWLDDVGRWSWWAGLAVQVAWHLACVLNTNALGAPCESLKCSWRSVWLMTAQDLMPREDTLMWWARLVAVPALVWNPQFTQVWRGFSKHILGLSQWYTLQCMVIMVRYVAWSVLGRGQAPEEMTNSAILTAHVFIALFTGFIYMLALKSVKIDTTPLFGSTKTAPIKKPNSNPAPKKTATPRRQPRQTISDVLDEVLASSTPRPQRAPASHRTPGPLQRTPGPSRAHASLMDALPQMSAPNLKYRGEASPSTRLGSLSIQSNPPQTPQRLPTPNRRGLATPGQDFDEMDWSPIPQLPRALNNSSDFQQPRAFGEAPTDPNQGPFWFKVPPAPVMPAHRDRNPPAKPRILEQPIIKPPNGFFRNSPYANDYVDPNKEKKEKSVAFAEPKFFAPERANDPTNQLADMLSTSFSLTLNDHPDDVGSATEDENDVSAGVQMQDAARDFWTQVIPTARHATAAQALLLYMLIMGWTHARTAEASHGEILGACLLIAGMVSTRDLGLSRVWTRLNADAAKQAISNVEYALCALYVVEIGMIIHLGSAVRGGLNDKSNYDVWGSGLFATMGTARLLQAVVGV